MTRERILRFAMMLYQLYGLSNSEAISLAAWVNRQTLDGMQTIQNDGFATQRPLSHGWNDSTTVKVTLGDSVTVSLRDQYKLTLHPTRATE